MEKHIYFILFFVPYLRRLFAHICLLEKIAQDKVLTRVECGSKSTMFHNLNIRIFFSRLIRKSYEFYQNLIYYSSRELNRMSMWFSYAIHRLQFTSSGSQASRANVKRKWRDISWRPQMLGSQHDPLRQTYVHRLASASEANVETHLPILLSVSHRCVKVISTRPSSIGRSRTTIRNELIALPRQPTPDQ